MRLFTAIDLPSEVLQRLEQLLMALRPEAQVKWSPVDNLHVTTKFIGAWEESRLDELHIALESLLPREAFDMEVKNLGWFPNGRSPRVLWAGVYGGERLIELARETEERLDPLGIKKEERAYSPHLTLARIKSPVPLQGLRQKVEELQDAAFGKFPVSQFALFRSDPGSNSSIYRKLREYRFDPGLAAS